MGPYTSRESSQPGEAESMQSSPDSISNPIVPRQGAAAYGNPFLSNVPCRTTRDAADEILDRLRDRMLHRQMLSRTVNFPGMGFSGERLPRQVISAGGPGHSASSTNLLSGPGNPNNTGPWPLGWSRVLNSREWGWWWWTSGDNCTVECDYGEDSPAALGPVEDGP
jgi:hypothetical protein